MYVIINEDLKQDIVSFEENLLSRNIDGEKHIVLELTISIGNFDENYQLTSQILKDLSFSLIEDSVYNIAIYNNDAQLIYKTSEYTSLEEAVINSRFDDVLSGNLFFKKILI